jgi:hypothetical protein
LRTAGSNLNAQVGAELIPLRSVVAVCLPVANLIVVQSPDFVWGSLEAGLGREPPEPIPDCSP